MDERRHANKSSTMNMKYNSSRTFLFALKYICHRPKEVINVR